MTLRRPSFRWTLLLPLAAAACAETAPLPLAPTAPAAPPELQRVQCVATRAEVRCDAPVAAGARGNLNLGGQGNYVRLTSGSPSYDAGQYTFFVTVQNLLGQAIGTVDGTSVAPGGVRVFFADAPVVTEGAGSVTVVGDGTAAFTSGTQPYYQYAQIVAPGATSAPRRWRLDMPATVTAFTFALYVSAPVRYADGWVDLGIASATLPAGGTATLTPVVRDRFGRPVAGATVTLSSSAPAVAGVDSGGVVTGKTVGTATITATSGTLTGSAAITVANRVASAILFPANLMVGATQQLTPFLRDSANSFLQATGRVIAYTSSDTSKVRVSATGLVTAVAAGTATLGITVEGISANATATVTTAAAGKVQMVQVAAGANHTCGLSTSGAAYCMGPNANGQLGNGQIGTDGGFYRNVPSAVSGGHVFTSITSGYYRSCGLTAQGEAWCWGSNDFGALGTGDTVHVVVPTQVSGGHAFTALVTSRDHGCGIDTAGEAWCWGHNNLGQLGNGGGADSYVPVKVLGGHVFTSISSTWDHTCAVAQGGDAYCWGYNLRGALGDGTTTQRATPVKVKGGITFASVSGGMSYSCGVSTTGAGWCWGDNSFSTLGNGGATSTESSFVPVALSGGITWAAIAAGPRPATCGVATSGAAYCWGRNDGIAMLGGTSNGSSTVPSAVWGGVSFASLSAGSTHTCGIGAGGSAYCWGPAVTGALGDGTYTNRSTPTPVARGEVP